MRRINIKLFESDRIAHTKIIKHSFINDNDDYPSNHLQNEEKKNELENKLNISAKVNCIPSLNKHSQGHMNYSNYH